MTLTFGPTTSLAVQDTSQIGSNAATIVVNASISGPVTITQSTSSFTSVVAASVQAQPLPYTVVITLTGTLQVTTAASVAPVTVANWTVEDELGATYGLGKQTIPAIPASTSANFSIVQEVTISVAAQTAKTFTFIALWNGTGTYSGGSMIEGTIKAEAIRR